MSSGVCVGEGLPPIPVKLADCIVLWKFVDIGDLLPEMAPPVDESGSITPTWIQCSTSYVSVLGPHFPEVLRELMAYVSTIVRVNQELAGLAWVRYDQAFRCQVTLQGNRKWSVISWPMYTMCFTGNAGSVGVICAFRLGFSCVSGLHSAWRIRP